MRKKGGIRMNFSSNPNIQALYDEYSEEPKPYSREVYRANLANIHKMKLPELLELSENATPRFQELLVGEICRLFGWVEK